LKSSRLPKLLRALQSRLPAGELLLDEASRGRYSSDKWLARRLPDAVALCRGTDSVSRVLRFASKHKIGVTARGAGYGYVGGCVPAKGGIVLSLEGMTRIKEIDAADFVGVVEPGVITARFQEAVERRGLYYPPDPASRSDCTLGGNIATNAGGPRCLKYGVTRDYVIGLEVVLSTGEVTRVGSRTHKNKTGFDLVGLFVGSEGLLGIVTEATLKLLPLPPYHGCLAVGFDSMKAAVRTLAAVFQSGILPSALEIADAFTLKAAYRRTGDQRLAGCRALLIVELDGQERSVQSELRHLDQVVTSQAPVFVQSALGNQQCEELWQLRREFSYALRDTGLTKFNEDIVVPRGKLEDLFKFTDRLQKRHGLPVACFGHAGDGNIHVNIMVDESQPQSAQRRHAALDDLFRQVIALGGVISGEHGIGLAKKPWWPLAASAPVRRLHRDLKRVLDPSRILNPGKFV
jgi:glycolate oxidase